ncbi:glycine cleavage system protein GcvH [bacterium]|nr:glycine cleavage system protein GcvH [bacterium]
MATIEGYEMPDDLYYHQEHAWARVEDDDNVRVGMNDMFQETAGDIVYVDLPFEGDEVGQGETCGKIQSSKWIGKLIAPVAGEVIEVNEELESDSTVINSDPYDEGWIMLIRPSNLDEDLLGLMQGEAVEDWLKEEIAKAEAEKKE